MQSWNVILQIEDSLGCINSTCTRYATNGVTLPTQFFIISCDSIADTDAHVIHDEIQMRLTRLQSNPEYCGRTRGFDCLAWREPSCQHVLVPMIGSPVISQQYEDLARDWLNRSAKSKVIPVLCNGVSHGLVFDGGLFPTLSQCNTASWGGSIPRLAEIIMTEAMLDEKPGVFLSYLRNEASAGVEQIHDALIREGFRVFLDRFSGTPGQLFPQELASAMSGMGLVVLMETASLAASRWTMWEAAFANRYRLGPIAVNFNAAGFPAVFSRHTLNADPSQNLSQQVIADIVDFIKQEHLHVNVNRRAYYETLIRLAAQSKNGDAERIQAGVLKVVDSLGVNKGAVLPCAVPGQLKHVRRLVEAATAGDKLLAGDHAHLSPSDKSDLVWLTQGQSIQLTGSASVYRKVQDLL